MIKNNYKNTILTSMIALTLLTSVIAVGGIQNAYAGAFGELDCTVVPQSVDIELAAGEEFELSKQITCDIDVDFHVEIVEFGVFGILTICDIGVEVGFSEPLINDESLVADFDEIILVLGDTEPGDYHCEIEFEAEAVVTFFFCNFAGDIIGPLTEEEVFDCEPEGGFLEEGNFFANTFDIEQEIWVEVPDTEPEILHVHIDIKPQSCPNPINTNSRGLLPVAILGNEVNVEDIDVSTVTLAGVSPILHSIEDVATPHTPVTGVVNPNDCSTEGPDGIDDLTLKFDTQDVVEALGAVRGEIIQVVLTGNLLDGTPIESYDVIIVR